MTSWLIGHYHTWKAAVSGAAGNSRVDKYSLAEDGVLMRYRVLWVLGPIRWSSPPDRGGGQDKAFENYNRGLEAIRIQKRDASDPLEPSWGEPELLMSLAWSNLNRTTPDLNAAEQDAQAALKIVPYWHYVRDILMPQI